jgi:vacuolar-type H+-ATPase subunit H
MAAADFKRHLVRLCGIAACLLLLLSLTASPAPAQGEPGRGNRRTKDVPPPGERLWKEYPLNPTPTGDAPEPTRSMAPRLGSTSARNDADGGLTNPATPLLVGVAIALFALLAAFALTLVPRPGQALQRSASQLPRFPNSRSRVLARRRRRLFPARWQGDDDGGNTGLSQSKRTYASAVDVEVALSQPLQARSDPMSKQPEQAPPAPDTPDERPVDAPESVDPHAAEYRRVGEKVTVVLASAQQAADEIVASAREEADQIRSDAREQAAGSTAEAKSEAERMQRESEKLRLEADDYAKETRSTADEHAVEARADAEAEAEGRIAEAEERAQAIVAEAEQRASFVEQDELRRQEALAAGARRYEDRLKSLLEVFRGMTTELEDLVRTGQPAGNEQAEPHAEGLEDALRPEHQTHARST